MLKSPYTAILVIETNVYDIHKHFNTNLIVEQEVEIKNKSQGQIDGYLERFSTYLKNGGGFVHKGQFIPFHKIRTAYIKDWTMDNDFLDQQIKSMITNIIDYYKNNLYINTPTEEIVKEIFQDVKDEINEIIS